MSYKRSEKAALRPMTIRFPAAVWNTIEDLASRYDMNKTDIIRSTLAGNLHHYLGTIRIADEEQAAEIEKQLAEINGQIAETKEWVKKLFDEVSKIHTELHRIGVNFNQSVRLRQIERKYSNSGMNFSAIDARWKEEQKVKSECKDFSKEDLDELITRYEKATAEAGVALCRILALQEQRLGQMRLTI